jgi:chromosome segregation ATPase
MSSDSESDVPMEVATPAAIKNKGGRPKKEPQPEVKIESKVKLPKRQLSQEALEKLAKARAKGLEKLTELRRQKKVATDELKKEREEEKQKVKEKMLDAAPKVREIDSTVSTLRAEMEALKKELNEAKAKPVEKVVEEKPKKKVKKIIYEDSDEDVEEVVEVVKRKSATKPKSLTGTELLDRLFFHQ